VTRRIAGAGSIGGVRAIQTDGISLEKILLVSAIWGYEREKRETPRVAGLRWQNM